MKDEHSGNISSDAGGGATTEPFEGFRNEQFGELIRQLQLVVIGPADNLPEPADHRTAESGSDLARGPYGNGRADGVTESVGPADRN